MAKRRELNFPVHILMVQWSGREREIHEVYRQKDQANDELADLMMGDSSPIWAEVQSWDVEW
jgi:hypothetical protein